MGLFIFIKYYKTIAFKYDDNKDHIYLRTGILPLGFTIKHSFIQLQKNRQNHCNK